MSQVVPAGRTWHQVLYRIVFLCFSGRGTGYGTVLYP
ncbi:unnamed protein product [Chondrus crispus]|uniref:Uncharacterized protein n=1 Tax=Chondrus crispus TaxID=2769 RepID=R7QBG1_CHOCR|nr:unnamed protein product [Chondrus crispus]CDF35108.1 unnamed protein product [Chondrus crispus]|eukprot:XP_005714927.1 unnamed protein product [Chondrus crispus]